VFPAESFLKGCGFYSASMPCFGACEYTTINPGDSL
jgi:hypothetical protein